ncbi:alanine racemase [Sphingobacterium faecale]|uniref:Alanine racemase n=1 Tax=Sphingobacterium faecale TaxID=2803775 RepID=A0ABS1R425_9SPHI|nr:alanine racemase [Sphingobacterium faecale]MBL1409413.1 alanine racemase [Sphingobacterium faecale]
MENKNMLSNYWIKDGSAILTPNLLLYPNLVKANINLTLQGCKVENLRPHIKTIKNRELVQTLLEAGVTKFKCATLSEARLLAELGAADVLLAYPLVGPNITVFLDLVVKFPTTLFGALVDSIDGGQILNEQAMGRRVMVDVFIDLNLGMNRTGVSLVDAFETGIEISKLSNLNIAGLHGYDGHIQDTDLIVRYNKVKPVLDQVLNLYKSLEEALHSKLKLVLGGSNTFSIYRELPFVECSPGTFMLWDWGYQSTLKEQAYHCAAILVSRVISKPTKSTLCLDLGHKAIAAENSINKRLHIIGHSDWQPISQSEEHLVVEVPTSEWPNVSIGDMHYIIPYHICPTVAKYPCYQVVDKGVVVEQWPIAQRY